METTFEMSSVLWIIGGAFSLLVTIIITLTKYIMKQLKRWAVGMEKEFILLKAKVYGMDDALEDQFQDGYADKRKEKEDQIIKHYELSGKL